MSEESQTTDREFIDDVKKRNQDKIDKEVFGELRDDIIKIKEEPCK